MTLETSIKRPIKPAPRYWDRVIGAIRSPERLLVELITNSIDSYKRLRAKQLTASGLVQVSYLPAMRGNIKIEVKDEAEGIPFKKLQKALEEYGEDTSGLSEGLPVRGTIGVGLKDVSLLMQNTKIITVHEGKLNECFIFREKGLPYVEYKRVNEPITEKERKNFGILKNGTIISGTILKEQFPVREFKTLYRHLCRHYMLRKVNQSPKKYQILLRGEKNQEGILKYTPPKGEIACERKIYVLYGAINYPVKIVIKKANKRLGQSGEFREGGLIVVYNEDAVADCSLFGFDADPYASRLYGEIVIEAEPLDVAKLFNPKAPIIDEKRRMGLDQSHPFIRDLLSEVRKFLKNIIESEREAKKKLKEPVIKSQAALDKVLREFNSMARNELKEKTDIVVLPPPLTWSLPEPPDFFKFYYDMVTIKEHQKTVIGLGILPNVVSDGSKIRVTSSDPRVQVTPNLIVIDSAKARQGLIREKLTLLGEEAGVNGIITAKHGKITAEMIVSVQENPLLNPPQGFAFIPDNIKVPDGKKKNAELIIDIALIQQSGSKSISFTSSTPKISCPSEMSILGREVIGGKVRRIRVPIKGSDVGSRGTVTAFYAKKQAKLSVKVIKPKTFEGMFTGFEFSAEKVPVIAEYDPQTGKIIIYKIHPMYKKHKDLGRLPLRTFITDTIIRKACEVIVKEGIRKQSAKFPRLADMPSGVQFIDSVSLHIEELYHKYGSRLCSILTRCIRKMP
jgi:hypothetical protein